MFNFQNIGKKIKTLAVIVSIVGVVVSIICGMTVMTGNAGVGLLIAILGSLASWVSSFFSYGFGELIEKTTEIANNTKKDIKVEIVNEDKNEISTSTLVK